MAEAVRAARIDTDGGRFAVNGPLTFATARRTCAAGISAFEGGSGEVVVDCTGVSAADSAGVAVLIEWRRWARSQGRALSFANLPAAIQGIARISGLEGVLGS